MKERTFEINVEDHNGFLRVFMGRGEPAGKKQRCQETNTPIAA
jgi:hypothetical protein